MDFQICEDMDIVLIEHPSTEYGWPLESIFSSKDPSFASQVFETSYVYQLDIINSDFWFKYQWDWYLAQVDRTTSFFLGR